MGLIEQIVAVLERFLPAIAGAAGSLLWISGRASRKIGVFCLGVFMGVYLGDIVSLHFELREEGSVFLMSLFGVSIVDKTFKTIDESSIGSILSAIRRNLK
ncbi:hypothetical protein AAEX37_01023 [Oligella sp. MSHR50489EDL]|uniref:hypothetical protein n=1 Tax=Oligella sp. MSHR50489EDL TaxID=3139409 RepID=UPI003D813E4A